MITLNHIGIFTWVLSVCLSSYLTWPLLLTTSLLSHTGRMRRGTTRRRAGLEAGCSGDFSHRVQFARIVLGMLLATTLLYSGGMDKDEREGGRKGEGGREEGGRKGERGRGLIFLRSHCKDGTVQNVLVHLPSPFTFDQNTPSMRVC